MLKSKNLNRRFFMKGASATALIGSAIGGGLALPSAANARGLGNISMSMSYEMLEG